MYKQAIIVPACLYLLLTAFVITVFGNDCPADFWPEGQEKNNWTYKRLMSPQRTRMLQPDRIVSVMGIQPDTVILDVGAGMGLFTFRFSKGLKGTGRVFATETSEQKLKYIENKNNDPEWSNITTMLVSSKGLDPFYREHSFDIIFMGNVYHHLWRHEEFFRELKPSLNKNGRLFVLHPKVDHAFSENMICDFEALIKDFLDEGNRFPVFQKLGKQLQEFIIHWKDGNDIPGEIKKWITQDFNEMLLDRRLMVDLLNYYYDTQEVEPWAFLKSNNNFGAHFQLMKWLYVQLEESGIFRDEEKKMTEVDRKRLYKLNRLILNGLFQPYRSAWSLGFLVRVEKGSIISTLQAAGYRFIREYDFLEGNYFLEFGK